MLRIHVLQLWYASSGPAMMEALYDTPVMRRSAGLDGLDDIPDETTIATLVACWRGETWRWNCSSA